VKDKKNINIWENDFRRNNAGFKTPDSFLEDFEDKMMHAISVETQKTSTSIIPIRSWLTYAVSAAAIIVLGLFVWTGRQSDQSLDQFSELDWDQVALFDESWILEELNLEEAIEETYDEEIDYLLAQGVTNEEILEVYQEPLIMEE